MYVLILVSHFHVLLLQTTGSLRPKIPEGSYDLCFRDSLLLKDGPRAVEAWTYDEITWYCYLIHELTNEYLQVRYR